MSENQNPIESEALIPTTESTALIPTGDEYITAAVVEINKVEQGLTEIRNRYGNLTINGLDDRPTYFAAVEGAKLVKKVRTGVENKRKELNEFPLKFQRAVNAEAKRITELLVPIEEHLKNQVEAFENAEAEEQRREAERKKAALIEAGFKFDGSFYVCGMHMVPAAHVAEMEDERLAYYVQEAGLILAAEKAAEERRAAELAAQQEEAKRLAAEREAIAQERAELEKLRAEMAALKAPKVEAPAEPIGKTVSFVPAPGEPGEPILQNVKAVEMVAVEPAPVEQPFLPESGPGHSVEYLDGFEHCREAVLAIFADPTPRKRGEFVEAIKLVRP